MNHTTKRNLDIANKLLYEHRKQIIQLTDRLTTAKKYTNHIGVCHFFESDKECTCGYDEWLNEKETK